MALISKRTLTIELSMIPVNEIEFKTELNKALNILIEAEKKVNAETNLLMQMFNARND